MTQPVALRVAAVVETVSLVVLVANLATVHWSWLASLVGPIHGTAYLAVIALVLGARRSPGTARWLALVPGLGGFLALGHLERYGAPRSDR